MRTVPALRSVSDSMQTNNFKLAHAIALGPYLTQLRKVRSLCECSIANKTLGDAGLSVLRSATAFIHQMTSKSHDYRLPIDSYTHDLFDD